MLRKRKRQSRTWLQAFDPVARFYSLSPIFFLAAAPSRRRYEHFGRRGLRGRGNAASITTSGAVWRPDWQRWVCAKSAGVPKRPSTMALHNGLITGRKRLLNFAMIY